MPEATEDGSRASCCLCGEAFGEGDRAYRCRPQLVFTVCSACGVPSRTCPADVEALYDDNYSEAITGGFRSEDQLAHARFTLRLLKRFCPEPGRILDVGCAAGDFLDAARCEGWDVRGVERQQRSARMARTRGLDILAPTIDGVPDHERFDVVTLLDVLEHVSHPNAFLERLLVLLKDGGLVYVETPNYASIFRRCLGRRWIAFIPYHETLYSPQRLASLLSGAGLEVLYQGTYACSLLSYDGLRRFRAHEPVYNLAVLFQAGLRRLHLDGLIRSRVARGAIRGFTRTLNWPFEKLLGQGLQLGDQLTTVARVAARE